MLILLRPEMERLLDMDGIIPAIEEAFRRFAAGEVAMPVRLHVTSSDGRGEVSIMPALVGGGSGPELDLLGHTAARV